IPQQFIRTATKWARGLLVILTLPALAQTLTAAQQAPELSVSAPGIAAPTGLNGCPSTVLPQDNSTSGNARCPSTKFASSKAVYLLTAAELAANGSRGGQAATSLRWDYFAAPGVSGSAPLKIYLQNTTDTTYQKG